MKLTLPIKPRADRRIHRTYEFLENFYLNEYPKRRARWAGVAVTLFLLLTWQILR